MDLGYETEDLHFGLTDPATQAWHANFSRQLVF